jgi:hypothetical protein
MLGHAPDLVGRAGGIDPRVEIAPLHALDCRAHALERKEDTSSPPQQDWHDESCRERERGGDR